MSQLDDPSLPKIGLAFSGASSRSVFYIGFLEVLAEHNIPIDYIAAMSSSAIVAAAYACGTLPQLKNQALRLNKEFFINIIEKNKTKGGLYNLDKAEEIMRTFTRELRFEEVKPLMGFLATDLKNGEIVVLSMGDIARAVRISCTLPGVFEPVPWGNKTLVDGGLLSVVPGDVVTRAGMDIVIGVHLRTTRHIFSKWQMAIKKLLDKLKSLLLLNQAERLWAKMSEHLAEMDFFSNYPDLDEARNKENYPGIFTVLGRSLDLAIKAQKDQENLSNQYACDLLIMPAFEKKSFWKKYLYRHLTDFRNATELYELGRSTGVAYVPKIQGMIADFQTKQKRQNETLNKILRAAE